MKVCQSNKDKAEIVAVAGRLYKYNPKNIEKCFAGDLYLASNTPNGSVLDIVLVSVKRGTIWSSESVWGYPHDTFIDVTDEYCLTEIEK